MARGGSTRRMLVWLSPEQVDLVRQVSEAAGLGVVAAGSPVKGRSASVAADLGAEPVTDLREALAAAPCDLVWLAAPGDFAAVEGVDDVSPVLAARTRGVQIATLEPVPASALDLAARGWAEARSGARPIDAVRFCPLARLSRPFRDAGESLTAFGEVRTATVEAWCRPGEGSLGAGIYGGLDLLLSLMGEPETIDAAFTSAAPGPAIHDLPGETLRDLHGDLLATLRYADGRSAGIVASDRAGRWNRAATLLGPGGRLRVFDDGFEWIGPDGAKLDASRPATARRGREPRPHAVAAIADALTDLFAPPDAAPADVEAVLATGQAALLSARTGQPESPSTIRRMSGVA